MDKALLEKLSGVFLEITDAIVNEVLERTANAEGSEFSLISEEVTEPSDNQKDVFAIQQSCATAFGVRATLLSSMHKKGLIHSVKRNKFVFLNVDETKQALKTRGYSCEMPDYSKLQTLQDYESGKLNLSFPRPQIAPTGYYTSRDIALLFNIETAAVTNALFAGVIPSTKKNGRYLVKQSDFVDAMQKYPGLFKDARSRQGETQ